MKIKLLTFISLVAVCSCNTGKNDEKPGIPSNLFEYSDNIEPRWVSFENMSGEKGKGARANNGAKGHACDSITAGATKTLLNIEGPGIINRIWVTINDRSPEMLRSLIINMYWDNEKKPAVSVPFGDFFGVGLGKTAEFENVFFANPEGQSFNCFIQMPFRQAARIEVVNQSDTNLAMMFYDVDLQLLKHWDNSYMYFHSYWHRDTATVLTQDFEIMPYVKGKGRYLGTNISVNANPVYKDYWWGEGEVKIYLDGDNELPTLVGSGTEDYVGTAWGQSQYNNKYFGCLIADAKNLQWAFYRYHTIDPIYFRNDCRVTIQQIGGTSKNDVIKMQKEKVKLVPVSIHAAPVMIHLYKKDSTVNLEDPKLPNEWTNFYRSDDYSAVSYFYLDKPANDLPVLQPIEIRTWNLKN